MLKLKLWKLIHLFNKYQMLGNRCITVGEREENPPLKEQGVAGGQEQTRKQVNKYTNPMIYESGSCSNKTGKGHLGGSVG